MSEQQWEYRVACDHGAAVVADAGTAERGARSLGMRECSSARPERAPVGTTDWQPYDPEADQ